MTTLEIQRSSLRENLSYIQAKLKASKNLYNSFGNYSYRSCEGILESLKPFLNDMGLTLTLTDQVVMMGDRFYIQATATIKDNYSQETAVAYAREADNKKGMDPAQVTGAASSYARKYALSGLFCIDDNRDADAYSTGEVTVEDTKVLNEDQVALIEQLAVAAKTDVKTICEAMKVSALKDIKESKYKAIVKRLEQKRDESNESNNNDKKVVK